MIKYPRKCPKCDYVANNPQMFSYHKRTHEPIPEDAKCHFGCGNKAIHRNTGDKLTCKKKWADCPEYLKKLSERIAKSWEGNIERKKITKKIFEEQVVYNRQAREKSIKSIKEKAILLPKDAKNYRSYARKCRKIAQQWAKENNYDTGRQTYHVDHKLSLLDCYYAGLSVNVASHPANLQIMPASENASKGRKSIITVEQLLEALHMKLVYFSNESD